MGRIGGPAMGGVGGIAMSGFVDGIGGSIGSFARRSNSSGSVQRLGTGGSVNGSEGVYGSGDQVQQVLEQLSVRLGRQNTPSACVIVSNSKKLYFNQIIIIGVQHTMFDNKQLLSN